MPEPHLRAADTDRAAVAAELGEHMAAGRLTLAEYDERVTSAYAATTFGDLAALTKDLPSLVRTPVPAAHEVMTAHAYGPAWPARRRHDHSFHAWLRVSLIVVTIWLMTSIGDGTLQPFWPMWVIGPWGAVLLSRRIGPRPPRPHHPADA